MSTTIDERVLEMRFDNRQFESNVSNTMSTLDKLKQKLNFTGASKGLENINAATKNVNMTGLGSAVETVTAKFSALQVMGVTALANITNSAVNAGKNIIKSLTIDPVMTGFSEYETKMGSIQTILANTEHQGTTLNDVTAALEELNLYADKTIYNFQEMTRNIGTFTAAGVDLETSVRSIQGIANLAAVSGSTSQQASTAMYQLSQALATGTVKLMDWNSVVNAGMGGKVFQDALIRTAAMLDGSAKDVEAWKQKNIDAFGSFRDSLTQGEWLTSEVLTKTLEQFTMAAEEGSEEWNKFKKSLMDDGYTEAQADAILKMANTATDAATKVKTFTQLMDTLKESAQSGWAQTWELLIGDFEEAKAFFTEVSDMIGGIIGKSADRRNGLLGGALNSNWDKLIGKLGEAGIEASKFEEAIRKAYGSDTALDALIQKHGSLANAVREGAINSDILRKALDSLTGTGANETIADFVEGLQKIERTLGFGSVGDDVKSLQTALEALGHSVGECKIDGIIGPDTTAAIKEFQKEAGLAVDGIAGPETIAALEKAGAKVEETSGDVSDLRASCDSLIDVITEKSGRELLLGSLMNILKAIIKPMQAVGEAMRNIFAVKPEQLYNAIEAFNKFTSKLVMNDKTAEKLRRTFEGLFAIIDIVATLTGGAFKIAFKVASKFLSYFNLDILDVTAGIGDALVGLRDFIDGILDIGGVFDKLAPYIEKAATAIKDWIESLKTSENLPADIVSGLINGLRAGVGMVWDAAVALAKSIVDAIKSFLGIHSPSTVMAEIGGNTVEGLKVGISAGIDGLIGVIKTVAEKVVNAFKSIWEFIVRDRESIDWSKMFGTGALAGAAKVLKTIIDGIVGLFTSLWDFITDESGRLDWGKLFSGSMLFGMVWFLKQIATAISGISEAFGGLGDVLENGARVLKSFSKVLNGYAWDLKAQALQKMAIAIGILVLAIVVLTEIDDIGRLWNAVGIIAALAVILGVLAFALDKMGDAGVSVDKNGAKIEGIKSGLLQIGIVMALLAVTVKMIGGMDPAAAKQGFLGLAGMAVGIIIFLAAISKITKHSKDLSQIGSMMLKLSIAMGLMILVLKMIDGLNANEVVGGIIFATAFAIFVRSIVAVAKSSGNNVSKVGGMMIKLAIAMGLMVGVVKLIDTLSGAEMLKGAFFAAGFATFLWALVKCTKIGKNQQIAKLGGLVLSVSFSLTLLVGVCKLVGLLSVGDMIKGAAFAFGFVGLLKVLVSVLTIGNEQKMAKVSGTILAMATAIAILAGVSVALSFVDLGGLAKGVAAVGILGLIMTTMVKALKGANNIMGSIIAMTVAIAVMAGAIVALTFIDDTSKLQAAAGALAIVMGMFALIAKCSNDINKAAGSLVIMTIAVGALAGILYLLTNGIDNLDAAIQIATSLGILMAALGISMRLASSASKTGGLAIGSIFAMVGVLALVAIIVGVLEALDVAPSIETAVSLSILLLALTGVTAILTTIGAGAGLALAGVGAFAIVVAGVGAVMLALAGLAKLFPGLQSWLDTGIDILGQIGTGIGKFVGGIIGGIGEGIMDSVLEMVNTFGEVVDKLVEISDVGTGIKTEGFDGVGKLIEALAGIALTSTGMTITDIFTGLFSDQTTMEKFQTDAVAFFDAMKAIGEASTGVTIDAENLDVIVKAGKKLADLQSCIEPIGGLASCLMGFTDLGTFGDNVKTFIESMKTALDSLWGYQFDAQTLDEVVKAAGSLAKLQSSLEPIGGVISWFTGRDDLGRFGINVAAFIGSMKLALSSLDNYQFDHQTFDEIIAAATSLATLQSSLEPIGGVITWFTGRDDLGRFGINVAAFITSMKDALSTLEGTTLDEAALASVIAAAEKLADFQSNLEPMGNVITWFTGRTDLGTFGVNIGLFADAMGKLKTAMGENGITEDAITSITNAGNAIIALQQALPEEGWFDGKMNLSEFSDYVTDFGDAMSTFGESAAGIDSAAVDTSISTAKRIKNLIESLVGLDTSGLAAFTGIGTGGIGADGAAYKIGQAISKYSEEVAGIDTGAVSTSVTAANKLKSLIAGLVGLDASGIENFKIEAIGKQMGTYANKVKNLDASVVSSSISAANRLKNFISSLSGLDSSGISNFKVEAIGKQMKSYGSSVSGLNSSAVSSSISAANRLKNFISGLSGLDTSGVGSFKTAVKELSTVKVSEMVRAFSGASTKLAKSGSDMIEGLIKGMKSKISSVKNVVSDLIDALNRAITSKASTFQQAGSALMAKFASGLSSKKGAVKTAATACIASAVVGLRSYYSAFYSAGSYLVSGFAAGISANSYKAAAKARAMANAAEKAAREALDINSPSKVFREIGMGIPEGFIQGIEKLSGSVGKSVYGMTDGAIYSVGDTISKLASLIETDIDSQPTIRPVLDLSDVRSGAATIGNLFDTDSSVGVMANLGTVGNLMGRYGQNGGNNDIVDAIDKLRKDLGNFSGDSYQVNGITYDDGSNIADAVKTITRVARMERRI